MNTTPQLPPPIPPAPGLRPRLPISPVAGMTAEAVHAAVAEGGRFVIFQYCISVLILTFKRSSTIYFVKSGESAFAKSLPFSLISLVLGWWGIPWGPIWTLTTLATNLSGGKDVTRDVLAAAGLPMPARSAPPSISPPAAAEREEKKNLMLRVAWGAVALLVLGSAFVAYEIYRAGERQNRGPSAGEIAFAAANSKIGSGGAPASGNSEKAKELAAEMSKGIQILRDSFVSRRKETAVLDEHDQFRTYCHLTENVCVFLVHVPELRHFAPDARKTLGEMACGVALGSLERTGAGKDGMRFAVGLRGIAAYDRVLIAHYVPGPRQTNSVIETVRDGIRPERELASWFESQ